MTVRDDPAKPYKAYVGSIVVALSYLITTNILERPWDIIVTAIVTGLSVYSTPNPKEDTRVEYPK